MELFRALAALAEPPSERTPHIATLLELGGTPSAADFTDVFTLQLYPYASVYLGAEGMLGGEARDRIAGFWRALGETPPAEPDHIALLLAAYARLCELAPEADLAAPWARARATFLWEHLLSWAPVYALKVQEIAPPAYAAWGALLREALEHEAQITPPPATLPLHLRHAPVFADPQDTLDDILGALLAPVRCGFILTRTDLLRAAPAIGSGLRAGERRYALRALIGQAPGDTFEWLRCEALGRAERYEPLAESIGDVGRFWQTRAREAATVLEAIVRDARSVRADS